MRLMAARVLKDKDSSGRALILFVSCQARSYHAVKSGPPIPESPRECEYDEPPLCDLR